MVQTLVTSGPELSVVLRWHVSSWSLRPSWFYPSCLDLAWFLESFIVLLRSFLEVLIIWSPVAFVEVMFATYWTTKLTLTNTLVQFGVVDHQTPKSKVNGPRVHFPYNGHVKQKIIQILLFSRWNWTNTVYIDLHLYCAKNTNHLSLQQSQD